MIVAPLDRDSNNELPCALLSSLLTGARKTG